MVIIYINVQIENHPLRLCENAGSRCGTYDYVDRRPGSGHSKVSTDLYQSYNIGSCIVKLHQ